MQGLQGSGDPAWWHLMLHCDHNVCIGEWRCIFIIFIYLFLLGGSSGKKEMSESFHFNGVQNE